MNQIEPIDNLDRIDLISQKLDQAEGIMAALETTLSISDTHHHKLPFAVTSAMQCISDSRVLIRELTNQEADGELEH